MLPRRLWLFLSLLLLLGAPGVARSDEGIWLWTEYRQPIVGWANSPMPRLQLRLSTDTRFFLKAQGLDEGFLRVALLLEPSPWFYIAVAGAVAVDRDVASLAYQQEMRLEIEPHFVGRIGPITYDDRNRLEFRHRQPVDVKGGTLPGFDRVRYRNLLRINLDPPKWRVAPFVLAEWMFNLDVGFDQFRVGTGLGIKVTKNVRLDVAYVYRTSHAKGSNEWKVSDHILLTYLFIGLPDKPTSRK